MIVRKVIGPFEGWQPFADACPVLKAYTRRGWTYVGDPFGDFGAAVRMGAWGGQLGVFEAWPTEGWRIVYVGNPTVCDGLTVEMLVVLGPKNDDTRFYWQSAAKYARRLDNSHYATGDPEY